MTVVDTKRGYVGMCNGRLAQQESGAALSKNSMFTAGGGGLKVYTAIIRCALIRDRQPTACTAWDGFAHPAETEATSRGSHSH